MIGPSVSEPLAVFLPLQDEKEQLLQYRSTIASLVGRAKAIVQLKPRNPESPIRTSIPVRAICDYRQIEVPFFSPLSWQLCGDDKPP